MGGSGRLIDVLERVERSLERLAVALAQEDDEVVVLAAMTVRTQLLLAQGDHGGEARFLELRARATALIERAPPRLSGTTAVFRLLGVTRRS